MSPCPYCTHFIGRTFKKLLGHIKFIHSQEPNFSITCGDCGKSYRKFASFKSHLQREERKKALQELAGEDVEHIEENDEEEYEYRSGGDDEYKVRKV